MHNLKRLDLYGNPVALNPSYKFRITENSTLERLDGLEVKGVVKERLDKLRKDWEVNQVIADTTEEAQKWIEAEREIKSLALSILAKKQERINEEFEQYKKNVDEDVLNFITYINELKQERNAGQVDKITFDRL